MPAGGDREGNNDRILRAVSAIACERSEPVNRCVVGARYSCHFELTEVGWFHGILRGKATSDFLSSMLPCPSRFFEIARVLVRLDHVAGGVVNADHRIV